MSATDIRLETLIENIDELYDLAKLTECKIHVPVSELRRSLEQSVVQHSAKIGVQIQKIINKGKPEEIIFGASVLAAAWVGASAIDVVKNKVAAKKAKEALLPMYKEIAVKTQAIILQLSDDNKTLTRLLLEEKQQNINNSVQIEQLQKRIAKAEAIVQRFVALQAKG